MPATLEYAGGERRRETIPCPDWFDSPSRSILERCTRVREGMDRRDIRLSAYDDANGAALFETVVVTDAARELVAVIFEPAEASFAQRGTTFNLFAVTGMEIVP